MFAKLRLPDICLTLLSVAFVAWAGLNGVCAFVYLIVAVYAFGKIVEICKQRSKLWGKITVLFGILLILTGLYIFKYATYASEVLNQKFGISLSGSPTWTFLGISFVSFSAISYIVDIFWGAEWQPVRCSIIFSFLPESYFRSNCFVERISAAD